MARVAIALTSTAEQKAELVALAGRSDRRGPPGGAGEDFLACLDGKQNDAVVAG